MSNTRPLQRKPNLLCTLFLGGMVTRGSRTQLRCSRCPDARSGAQCLSCKDTIVEHYATYPCISRYVLLATYRRPYSTAVNTNHPRSRPLPDGYVKQIPRKSKRETILPRHTWWLRAKLVKSQPSERPAVRSYSSRPPTAPHCSTHNLHNQPFSKIHRKTGSCHLLAVELVESFGLPHGEHVSPAS